MAKNDSNKRAKNNQAAATGGGLWFLGFVGALIYYWESINSFWLFLVVVFKSIFWPAYLVNALHQLVNL